MTESEDKKTARALSGGREEIDACVHDPSPRVLRSLLQNPHLDEKDILIVASRKNLQPDILETIAKDKRWADSYPVRLALARNPRSPLSVSLSLARFLRVFDLEEITRNHSVPIVLRRKIETMLIERIPSMALGNKKTLAKKAAGAVLLKLLQDRIPEVVKLCLNNPHLIEAHLFKVISRPDTIAQTIIMIARHPLWSNRPLIRLSLIRNSHTTLVLAQSFLTTMKLVDLRDLYADPSLPGSVKPFVYRELLNRGSDPDTNDEDRVYEVGEDELAEAEAGAEREEFKVPEDDNEENIDDQEAG